MTSSSSSAPSSSLIELTGFDLEISHMSRILHGSATIGIDLEHVTRRLQHAHKHTPKNTDAAPSTLTPLTLQHAALHTAEHGKLRPNIALLAAVIQLNTLLRAQSGASDFLLQSIMGAIQRASSASNDVAGSLGAIDAALANVSLVPSDAWSDSAQLAQLWRPLVDSVQPPNVLTSADIHALLSAHSVSFAATADLIFATDAAMRAAVLSCALSADALGLSVSLWPSASAAASPSLRRVVRDLQLLMEESVLTRAGERPSEAFIGSPAIIAATLRAMEMVSDELRRAVNSHDSALLLLVPPLPAESSSSKKHKDKPTLTSKLASNADKRVPAGDDESTLASESRGAPVDHGHFVLSGTGAHVAALSIVVQSLVSSLIACGQSSVNRCAAMLEQYPRAECARRCLQSFANSLMLRLRRAELAPLAELVQLTPLVPTLFKVLAIECAVAGSVLRYRQSPDCESSLARPLTAIPPKLRVAAAAFERLGADEGDILDLAPVFDLFLNPGKLRSINPLIPRPTPK